LLELSERIHSAEFAEAARHPDHPRAFTRRRKLPLPALIASLLSLRGQSQQVALDSFFSSLSDSPLACRGVSDRAFAKARAHLHMPALAALNDWLVQRADDAGLVARWNGLRVVAADGSVLMPAVRACTRTRGLAAREQRLFALFLPGAELSLHVCVYDPLGSERQLLVESLEHLGPQDLLVLDRGYPASWLVSLLQARGIRWCMRCDNDGGWAAAWVFQRAIARLIIAVGDFFATFDEVLSLLAAKTHRFVKGRSCPRRSNRAKSHPNLAYKA
jgi:hypothetical protein